MNEKLVTENLQLIHYVIKKMGLGYRTEDDYQEYYDDGLIGLINGAKAYKEDAGIKPSTLLTICIKNEIIKGIKNRKTNKRKLNYETISLNDYINEDNDELMEVIPDNKIDIEKETNDKLMVSYIESILKWISKNKKRKEGVDCYARYYGLLGYKPMSREDIGKIYKIKKKTVDARIFRINNIVQYIVKMDESDERINK